MESDPDHVHRSISKREGCGWTLPMHISGPVEHSAAPLAGFSVIGAGANATGDGPVGRCADTFT
jgi:hypothetical protein